MISTTIMTLNIKQVITKIKNWIMAKYATLKAAIEEIITTNGNYEISGEDMRETLKAIVDSLGADYQLVGFALPATDPGTPDQNVAYLAGPGTYPNFGPTTVEKGQIGLFKYNGTWSYETLDCGVYLEYEEYPGGDAFEWTFYDSDNPYGLTIKIAKTVSGLGNNPDVAISQWWAAQTERKINVLGGYTISIDSLTTTPQSLGLFKAIQSGQIIDSIIGANKLIFGTDGGGSVTVNASDLPYKATANLVNVRTDSGTANNVSIVVRGINDILPAYININEIANHPAAYANAATALGDVPTLYRRKGMKVVYFDDTQQLWIEMINVDDAGAEWWTDVANNWVIEGPIETDVTTSTGGKQLMIGGVKKGNLDDVLNVNVWNEQATEYATQAAARAAVPANKRKLGAIITYLVSTGTDTNEWMIEKYIGSDITDSNWVDAVNWKRFISDIQNINLVTGIFRNTSGSTLAEPTEQENYGSVLLPVKTGDIFNIICFAGSAAGNWATYSSSNNKVRRKTDSKIINEIITIEEGESWLVINANMDYENHINYFNIGNTILLLRDEIKDKIYPVVNLSQDGTTYTTRANARNSVETKDRQIGVILTYQLIIGTEKHYIVEQFKGGDSFADSVNWVSNEILSIKGSFPNNNEAISSGKITKVGDAYFNTVNQVIYICNSYTNPSTMTFTGMNVLKKNDLVMLDGYLCYFDGVRIMDARGDMVQIDNMLFSLIRERVKYVVGKNLYDKKNILPGCYFEDGRYTNISAYWGLSNVIDVIPGQYLHINKIGNSTIYGAWFDMYGKRIGLIQSSIQTHQVPEKAKYALFAVQIGNENTCQIEVGQSGTDYEPYTQMNIADDIDGQQEIVITCKRNGVAGVDADFVGLTAISDALNSITDASKYKKYRILIDGIFEFTDPATLPMPDISNDEYSIIYAKPYVSFEGFGPERTILSVIFPADVVFPTGKHYYDYQPIYVDCDGDVEISNMSVLGKNCRYSIHLEHGTTGDTAGAKRIVKNCRVIHYGMDGISSAGFEHAFGCGIGYNHKWLIENCYIKGTGASFAIHTALQAIGGSKYPQGVVNVNNCILDGTISAGAYQNDSKLIVNFNNCVSSSTIQYKTNQSGGFVGNGLYDNIDFRFNTPMQPLYNPSANAGKVLMIRSNANGAAIRFKPSTAFASLICAEYGINVAQLTRKAEYTINGYFYKDGGMGVKGYAYGIENANNNGLAKALGDCSSVNKTLIINIDGVDYNVIFNVDYTNLTNDAVLTAINNVISSTAEAIIYSPDFNYLPEYSDVEYYANSDNDAILTGMGVVITSNGVRKALNSDGYIDGICLDDIANGEIGRVITKGCLHGMAYGSTGRFYVRETDASLKDAGVRLGIKEGQPGIFDKESTPKLVRYIKRGVVEIN